MKTKELDMSKIFREVYIKKKTMTEVSKKYNTSQSTISRRLKYFEIEIYIQNCKKYYTKEELMEKYNLSKEELIMICSFGENKLLRSN